MSVHVIYFGGGDWLAGQRKSLYMSPPLFLSQRHFGTPYVDQAASSSWPLGIILITFPVSAGSAKPIFQLAWCPKVVYSKDSAISSPKVENFVLLISTPITAQYVICRKIEPVGLKRKPSRWLRARITLSEEPRPFPSTHKVICTHL